MSINALPNTREHLVGREAARVPVSYTHLDVYKRQATGGAILLYLMLRRAVIAVPGRRAVPSVGHRRAAASGTGGRAAVLAAVVVRPVAVAVAVARAAVHG